MPADQMNRSTASLRRRARRLIPVAIAVWGCAALAACGDDGTEGLSACPDGKIVLDKMNILRCAPMMNRAGTGATASSVNAQSTATKAASTGASTAAGASNGSGSSSSGNSSSGNSSSGASNGSGNSSGSGSQPSSGSGSKPAASSGASSSAQIPKGPWACFQANDICSCTPDTTGSLGDMCKTHPTCCTYVVSPDNMIHSCLCVPAGSAQCDGMRADTAMYPPASKCPPS